MQHSFPSPRALGRAATLSATLAGSLALGAATIGLASPASAAPAPTLEKPAVQPEGAGGSGYLAGYQVTPSLGLASASATFTVPKSKCTAADKEDGATYWVGVYSDDTNVYAFLETSCSTSGTTYGFDFATPDGGFVEPGAAPGDVVVASLFQSSSNTYAEIHDLTQGVTWLAGDPTNLGDTTVDVGTFLEGPIPTFAPITMSNTTLNGDYLGFESPSQVNTVDGGTVLVKSGKLKTTDSGSSFTLTFEHAQ